MKSISTTALTIRNPTKISAGVDVGIGGHSGEKKGDEQFEISDPRNVEEVYKAIEEQGLQPVMSDYIYV
mgnify:CR=1 FL=1